ncbi:MAG: 6,7-dimethyl-8-ribityllumazine synthase [Chloroflexi bacterium]|nr:6,7-dimethyl-8-ribityllumazine synthase [Chloroflexota bacterium]MCL5075170.1 6,7-dimethyl-8-ribityllumazine synthase [Chloroflexota bacterium]
MRRIYEGNLLGAGLHMGVVLSRVNDFVGNRLLEGAMDALLRHGVREEDVDIALVPGAFELPLVAKKMAQSDRFDAVICLGVVIRGDTPHFEYIAAEVSKGIANTALETGVPITFGVITADSLEQAIERAGAKAGNKGFDAAVSAVEMANLMKKLGGPGLPA